jgi:hypothetical protein
MDITTTPTAHQYVGYDYRDKNGTRVGWAGVVNNTNGSKYFQIQNQGGVDGFHFPMCTTLPTTTSSATNYKVAVVVQNYRNGLTWYRVWSDKFLEQGFNFNFTGGEGHQNSVTLAKAYGHGNYTVMYNANSTNHFTNLGKSSSSFTFKTYETNDGKTVSGTCQFYISGYMA